MQFIFFYLPGMEERDVITTSATGKQAIENNFFQSKCVRQLNLTIFRLLFFFQSSIFFLKKNVNRFLENSKTILGPKVILQGGKSILVLIAKFYPDLCGLATTYLHKHVFVSCVHSYSTHVSHVVRMIIKSEEKLNWLRSLSSFSRIIIFTSLRYMANHKRIILKEESVLYY